MSVRPDLLRSRPDQSGIRHDERENNVDEKTGKSGRQHAEQDVCGADQRRIHVEMFCNSATDARNHAVMGRLCQSACCHGRGSIVDVLIQLSRMMVIRSSRLGLDESFFFLPSGLGMTNARIR